MPTHPILDFMFGEWGGGGSQATAAGTSTAEAIAAGSQAIAAGVATAEAIGAGVSSAQATAAGASTAEAIGADAGQKIFVDGGIWPIWPVTFKKRPLIKSGTGRAHGLSDAEAVGTAVWQAEFHVAANSKANAKSERLISPTDEDILLIMLLAA